jgi:hypothetical protein
VTPADITIAVTVFDRRQYIKEAIASALKQTRPVRVLVVEDCGPDAGLEKFVRDEFGSQIDYYRNPARRGLFGNWNSCIEQCATPYLCILHDDDFLAPRFIEAMIELEARFPGKGLYHGRCNLVDNAGKVVLSPPVPKTPALTTTDVAQAACQSPLSFPGEIMRVACVKELGGFLTTSFFTGDWDMWFRLTFRCGAAGTDEIVGSYRGHNMPGRGTVRVVRNGKVMALTMMQAKKNLGKLRRSGTAISFNRASMLKHTRLSTRFLLENAHAYTPRLLAYNVGIHSRTRWAEPVHRAFQVGTYCFGPAFFRAASNIYNQVCRLSKVTTTTP